jgi:hypothetical protein
MFISSEIIVEVMLQQSHLKRNKDAGAYNAYKFAGLTGLTKTGVYAVFDKVQAQYLEVCKFIFRGSFFHHVTF